MKTLHFQAHISAPREKVWRTMLDDATYRIWTEVFNPTGSYYVGDWNKGSKILFVGPDKEGKKRGMVSMIEENKPYEFLSIKHVGIIKDGIEDTTSDAIKGWTPAFENYTFKDVSGATELLIDVDTNDEYGELFKGMWPKALEKLKELAES